MSKCFFLGIECYVAHYLKRIDRCSFWKPKKGVGWHVGECTWGKKEKVDKAQ